MVFRHDFVKGNHLHLLVSGGIILLEHAGPPRGDLLLLLYRKWLYLAIYLAWFPRIKVEVLAGTSTFVFSLRRPSGAFCVFNGHFTNG
jgi:hypothetical protein